MRELPEVSNVDYGEEQSHIEDNVDNQEIAKDSAVENDFVQLDPVQQKKFNKLTWEKNEERRKNAELQKRLEELQSVKTKTQEVEQAGSVDMPDEDLFYSDPDEYKTKMADWRKSVIKEAESVAQSAAKNHFQAEQTQAQKLKAQEEAERRTNAFRDRADSSGLTAEQMIKSEEVLVAYNPSPDLANFILDDDHGPQIMNYLANNQAELAEIVQMQPMRAALRLNDIRSKAVNVKTSSKAPDPIDTLGGRGVQESDHPLSSGVTFE